MPLPLQPPVSVPVGPTGRSFYVEEPTKRSDSSIEFDAFDAVQAGMGAKRPRQFFPWKGSVPGVIRPPTAQEKLATFQGRMQADNLSPASWLKASLMKGPFSPEATDNLTLLLDNTKQALFPKKAIEPTTFDLLPEAVHEEMASQKGIPLGSIARYGLEQISPTGQFGDIIEGAGSKGLMRDELGNIAGFEGTDPSIKKVADTVRAFERPVMNQAEDLGNFLGSPVGMAAALAAKTPIGRIVSGLFSADLASGAPELIRQKRETLANPKATLEEKVDAVLSDTLNKIFIAGTAGHALKGRGAPVNTERGLMRREPEILEPEIVGPEAGPGPKPTMAIEKYKEPSDTVLDVVSEKGPTIESAEGIRNLYEQKRPEIEGIAKNEKVIKALEKELTAKVEKIWSLPENQGMGKPSPESIRKMAEDAFRQGPPDVRRDMTDWVRERAEKEGREIVEKQQEIPSAAEAQGREAIRYQELRNKVIKENAAELAKIKNPADLQVAITELARKEQEKITAPTPEEIQVQKDRALIDQAIAEQVIGEKVPARPFNKPYVTPFEPPVIPKESVVPVQRSSVPKKTLPLGPKEKLPGFDPAKDIDFKAIEGGPEKTVPTPAEPLFKEPTPAERAKITGSELPRNIRERGTKLYTGGEIAFAIDKFKDMIRNGRAYPIRLSEKAREKYNLGEAVVDAKTGEVFHPGNESIKLDLLPEDKIPWHEGERTKNLFDGMREAADKGFEQRPKIQQELPLPESEVKQSPPKQGASGGDKLFSNPLADPEQLKKVGEEANLYSGPGFLFIKKFWKEFGGRRGAPIFRSITDKIHNETKDIPGGPEVEAGLRYRMAQERQIRNRWISELQNRVLGEDTTVNAVKRLASFFKNEKEQEAVGEYLYKKRAGMKPAALSDPHLQKIADSITDLYFDSQSAAIKNNIKNIAGEPLTQYPKSKGYYPWDMMKENFNNVLRTGKPAPDFNRVKSAILNHWLKVEPRLNKAAAEKEFSDYLQMLRSGTGSFDRSADFNALRKFSGRGLPLELVDTNVLRTGEKYFHRYAKDMSWERMKQQVPGIDYVLGENNAPTPDIQAKFGQLKEQAGDVYKDWLETEFNPRQSKFGDVGQAANRLGANMLISAAAPLRDVVQLMQEIPAKVGVSDLPMAMKALGNHKRGIELAQESGAYSRTFTHLKDAALNPSQAGKAVRVMDSMSIFLRKIRGRDFKDKKEAGYLASLADVFVQSEVLKARAGEKEAIQNIRNIGEGVTGGVDALLKSKEPIPTEQHLELIHGFVESVRGKYDARSQPRWAIDGWTAPFFSLARWSIGKTNQFRNELLNPATKGNWKPLLRYTLGGIVAGSVINELNELLNQKRRESPTVGEAFKEGDNSEKIIAILDNLSLAGWGGSGSALLSAGMEALVEKDARAAGNKLFIGAPALEIGYTIRDAVVDVINNSKSDMDLIEGLAQIGASTTEAIFGEARILNRNLFNPVEAEEKSDSRDVRAWEDLRDFPAAPKAEIQNAPPADEGAKELRRKYGQKKKLTPDESRQFKADFEAYADELRASALGQDPEKVYNKLEALKSAQIYPSIPSGKTISGKAKSDDFVNFIENTQGEEEARDIEDKIKTNLHHEGYDARLDAFIKGYMAKHYKMNTKMFNKQIR